MLRHFFLSLIFTVSMLFAKSQLDSLDRASMDRNLKALVQMQKERENKQKKQAYIRIGLGVLFLSVLVVGIMRRRRKTAG